MMLLQGPAKRGQTMEAELPLPEGSQPVRLRGVATTAKRRTEVDLTQVELRLLEDRPTELALQQLLAHARERRRRSEDPKASICDLTVAFDQKADCAQIHPLSEQLGVAVSLSEAGLAAVTRETGRSWNCSYLFSTTMDISQPTLCYWTPAQVAESRPLPDLPGCQLVRLRFLSCPDHTMEIVRHCFDQYGPADDM